MTVDHISECYLCGEEVKAGSLAYHFHGTEVCLSDTASILAVTFLISDQSFKCLLLLATEAWTVQTADLFWLSERDCPGSLRKNSSSQPFCA